ncbi:SCO2322 family protein [Streptomyces kunmingensis]|uniref:SCO2322 family protein n=1 Tax=Streptomyces kunmingensis TaxID=68225 RepID=A0ABU6C4U7_9ACTN|nr:SCO2322 family protein [Streptomyces kunmingensis]MEB3959738.1 SCO2322 family protein [Streptomyces kunmingensis]
MTRTKATAGLVLGLLFALLGLTAAPAQAAGYRYWSFWERTGDAWTYASMGPSGTTPSDGDVQGFRFSVSADSKDATQPRGTADFDTICAGTPAKGGDKRVALVIDFGTAQDAPGVETPPKLRTACAQLDEDATSADALASVAKPLRYNSNALLCAIAGYPETGCGEQVTKKSTEPSGSTGSTFATDGATATPSTKSSSGPSVGVIAGVAVVAVLGVGAIWQAKRRRG